MKNDNSASVETDGATSAGSDRAFGSEFHPAETDNVPDSSAAVTETKVEGKVETTQPTTETKVEETKPGESQLTEKGTKLDPNPQSAVHQQLANERKIRQQMETVLKNPELLSRFMKEQYGGKLPVTEQPATPAIKEYKAEDFENLEDVAKTINGLQQSFLETKKTYEEKIATLSKTVSELTGNAKQTQVAGTINRDVSELQGIKELDPKSPEFIEGLEEKIVNLYNELDFDEESQTYRGNYSIAKLGKVIVDAARIARSKGSQQAQTVVKDKSEGRVKTSDKVETEVDSSQMSASDSIAAGISKMFR